MIGDDLETVGKCGNNIGRKMFRMAWQNSVNLLTFLNQFVTREDTIFGVCQHLIIARCACLNSIAKTTGNQKPWFLGHANAPGFSLKVDLFIIFQTNTYTKKPSIGDQPNHSSFSLRGKPEAA
jgi:hypothetical protein